MSLFVVSYPDITQEDARRIADIRQRHRSLDHSVAAPHFTLVFHLHSVDDRQVARHVKAKLSGWNPITFVLRCCLVVKDDSDDKYYAVLVPDEGFSSIVKLHDRLYTGILTPHLRLDIPFIPHVTIGYSVHSSICKAVADELNDERFEIGGTISTLDLLRKNAEQITTVERFPISR